MGTVEFRFEPFPNANLFARHSNGFQRLIQRLFVRNASSRQVALGTGHTSQFEPGACDQPAMEREEFLPYGCRVDWEPH